MTTTRARLLLAGACVGGVVFGMTAMVAHLWGQS